MLTARRTLVVLAIALASALAISPAPALADASQCSSPTLTQPFSTWGDNNWYALAPGQSPGSFDGNGWTLGNGARIVTTTVYGDASGAVLQLPSGAWAVSPETCIDGADQAARMMVRSVYGAASVSSSVSYRECWNWSPSEDMGTSAPTGAWSPSPVLGLTPPSSGWQMARFTLRGGGDNAGSEVYNFYIDPYGRG